MSRDRKDDEEKKKKRQGILEAEIYRIINQCTKSAVNQALDEILKDFKI